MFPNNYSRDQYNWRFGPNHPQQQGTWLNNHTVRNQMGFLNLQMPQIRYNENTPLRTELFHQQLPSGNMYPSRSMQNQHNSQVYRHGENWHQHIQYQQQSYPSQSRNNVDINHFQHQHNTYLSSFTQQYTRMSSPKNRNRLQSDLLQNQQSAYPTSPIYSKYTSRHQSRQSGQSPKSFSTPTRAGTKRDSLSQSLSSLEIGEQMKDNTNVDKSSHLLDAVSNSDEIHVIGINNSADNPIEIDHTDELIDSLGMEVEDRILNSSVNSCNITVVIGDDEITAVADSDVQTNVSNYPQNANSNTILCSSNSAGPIVTDICQNIEADDSLMCGNGATSSTAERIENEADDINYIPIVQLSARTETSKPVAYTDSVVNNEEETEEECEEICNILKDDTNIQQDSVVTSEMITPDSDNQSSTQVHQIKVKILPKPTTKLSERQENEKSEHRCRVLVNVSEQDNNSHSAVRHIDLSQDPDSEFCHSEIKHAVEQRENDGIAIQENCDIDNIDKPNNSSARIHVTGANNIVCKLVDPKTTHTDEVVDEHENVCGSECFKDSNATTSESVIDDILASEPVAADQRITGTCTSEGDSQSVEYSVSTSQLDNIHEDVNFLSCEEHGQDVVTAECVSNADVTTQLSIGFVSEDTEIAAEHTIEKQSKTSEEDIETHDLEPVSDETEHGVELMVTKNCFTNEENVTKLNFVPAIEDTEYDVEHMVTENSFTSEHSVTKPCYHSDVDENSFETPGWTIFPVNETLDIPSACTTVEDQPKLVFEGTSPSNCSPVDSVVTVAQETDNISSESDEASGEPPDMSSPSEELDDMNRPSGEGTVEPDDRNSPSGDSENGNMNSPSGDGVVEPDGTNSPSEERAPEPFSMSSQTERDDVSSGVSEDGSGDSDGGSGDDDLLGTAPAFLLSVKEISERPLPVTPEKFMVSSRGSLNSSQDTSLEHVAPKKALLGKSESAFSLDGLLADKSKADEVKRLMGDIHRDLTSDGGFVAMLDKADDKIDEDCLLEEHQEVLNTFIMEDSQICNDRPGQSVFSAAHYQCLYGQTLHPTHCGFVAPLDPKFIEKYLRDVTTDGYLQLLTADVIQMCFSKVTHQGHILRWLLFLMSVHKSFGIQQGCYKILNEILHTQSVKDLPKWSPPAVDVVSILVNYGADLDGLIAGTDVSHDSIRNRLFRQPQYVAPPAGEPDTGYKLHNLRLVLEVLAYSMQGKVCSYPHTDLTLLLAALCRASLDIALKNLCAMDVFANCVAMVVKQYSKADWLTQRLRICRLLSGLADHHHNQLHVAQLLAPDSRGRYLQTRVSRLMLHDILAVTGDVSDTELDDMKISQLFQYIPYLKDLVMEDPYKLASVINLLDLCVGNSVLKSQDREDLQRLVDLVKRVCSEVRDSLRNLDRTRVKDMMVRVCSRWYVYIQSTKSKQTKIFQYAKHDSPRKLKIEKIVTSQSDSSSESSQSESDDDSDLNTAPCKMPRLVLERFSPTRCTTHIGEHVDNVNNSAASSGSGKGRHDTSAIEMEDDLPEL